MQSEISSIDGTDNPSMVNPDENSKSKNKEPLSPYVLLFCILVIAVLATWIVPAGDFQREIRNGVTFVVPDSLQSMERHGLGLGAVFMAIVHGTVKSANIIFLIIFTGGALAVLEHTAIISTLLNKLSSKAGKSDVPVIISIAIIFAILGTTGVVSNASVAFVPVGILLARSMNLPTMFGMSLIYLSAYSGFNVAIMSPQTTGLTQRLAELPLFSGIGLRSATTAAFVIANIIFLTLYARRCRREEQWNPIQQISSAEVSPIRATPRQKLALVFSALALCTFMFGALELKWGEEHMSATFIVIAIGAGLICGISSSTIANKFLDGCGKMAHGALIVGLARAISIVLDNGHILDPIVNALAHLLAPLHPMSAAIGMYLSAAIMHVAISSGSGESAVLIPIFSPLGDALHLTRQVTVHAVLFGEGIVNCINPTSGVLMSILATAGIPYTKWIRFVFPLIAVWSFICTIVLAIGVTINWGPF